MRLSLASTAAMCALALMRQTTRDRIQPARINLRACAQGPFRA